MTGNCVGILIFDDAATEIPDFKPERRGGDWTGQVNSRANNRFCLPASARCRRRCASPVPAWPSSTPTREHQPQRHPRQHAAVDPAKLQFPAAGLALLSLPPFNNTGGVDPGPVENVP